MSVKKHRSAESVEVTIARYLRLILSAGVMVYLFLVLAVMPFYNQEGYSHIGSDKSYFFRTYTGYAAKILLVVLIPYWVCLLVGFLRRTSGTPFLQRLRTGIRGFRLNITDICALCYACVTVISYLCSDYRETALWGTSGWYMGMIPQLMLVGIYFMASRFCCKGEWMIALTLAVSAVVFGLGCLNRFDIWPITMENSGRPDFISTIGNINWFCGYMVCAMFLGIGLFWSGICTGRAANVVLCLYNFLAFAAAVVQGSVSGLFALGIALIVLFVCSAREYAADPSYMKRFWELILLLGLACGAMWTLRRMFPDAYNLSDTVFDVLTASPLFALLTAIGAGMTALEHFRKGGKNGYRVSARIVTIAVPSAILIFAAMVTANTLYPGILGTLSEKSIFTFQNTWGSNRGATWSAGILCHTEQNLLHRLVGIGPDCMADYIYTDGSETLQSIVTETFGDARLTNAHCEWLTILADEGLLGMLAYVGMMLSAIVRAFRLRRRQPHSRAAAAAFLGGLCVLAYTCNNIWSFQQSMSVATIFVLLGIGANAGRTAEEENT